MNVEEATAILIKSARGETVELNAVIMAKLVMIEQRMNAQAAHISRQDIKISDQDKRIYKLAVELLKFVGGEV